MAAKKKKKPLARKTYSRTKKQIEGLRRINKIEELNGLGARENVVSSYFSTLYFLTRNRQAWGNSASYYLGSNFALKPEDLFQLGDKIKVQPGATYEIESSTALVVRGEKHSLVILLTNDLYPSLNPLDFGKKLTLGAAFRCIKMEDPRGFAMVFSSNHPPSAIAIDDSRRWSLVVGSKDHRAWKLDEGSTVNSLSASYCELRFLSYFNFPHVKWEI